MTERPIPFSSAMVRPILWDTKTQTRRVVKPRKDLDFGCMLAPREIAGEVNAGEYRNSPYGQPGDRLWVREAYRAGSSWNRVPPRSIYDSEAIRFVADEVTGPAPGFGKLRPGMFMMRWMSRISLHVLSIRAEHLHDITEADAMAEGIVRQRDGGFGLADTTHYHHTDPRISYWSLWEAINGRESLEANPWVWVVAFKRIDA